MAAGPLALSSGERGSEWAARRLLESAGMRAGEGGTCSVPGAEIELGGCTLYIGNSSFLGPSPILLFTHLDEFIYLMQPQRAWIVFSCLVVSDSLQPHGL